MDDIRFKRASRRLVGELVLVVALSFEAGMPRNESYADAWRYVGRHPTLLLHVVIGAAILVEAAVLAVRCMRARQPLWSALAAVGCLAVVVAFVAGERSLQTQRNAEIDVMGTAWFAALVCYAIGWYLARRRQRARDKAPTAAPLR